MKHNWEYKRLSEIGTIITGSTPSTSVDEYYTSADYMFVKPGDIDGQGLSILKKSEVYISAFAYNRACRRLPKYAVLVTCIGIIGKVGILQDEGTCNQQINAIIPSDLVNYKYLGYALLSIKQILNSRRNGPVVPIINKSQFSKFQVPVPPMDVQRRIVAELDKINELIGVCRELLRNLDALAQSLFYDYFGDPITNSKGFSIVPLSEAFSLITDGTHQTPTYTNDIENGVKFLSAKDVANGFIDWTKIKYIPFCLHVELHKRLAPQRGDILLCKNGTTGVCALVDTDDIFDIYVSLALLRPKPNTCGTYLVYAINNPFTRAQFNHSLKGIGVPNLHLNKIRSTKIILPPIELQEEFAARIEQIDAQKKDVEELIASLQTLLDSRMDYWFN